MTCQSEWNTAVHVYSALVVGSVALTLFVRGLYVFHLRRALEGSPRLTAQYFGIAGVIKLTLAFVIAVFFIPACPKECDCKNVEFNFHYYIYPVVAFAIGSLWIKTAYDKWKVSQEINASNAQNGIDNDEEAATFNKVSTVEIS